MDLTEKALEREHLGFHFIRSDILIQTHIISHSSLDIEFQAISAEFIVPTILFAITAKSR
jgi:hypothetical protein